MAWTLIKQGGEGYQSSAHKEWLIDQKSDKTTGVPTSLGAPGSIVYTANLKNIYIVNSAGTLVTVQEET